MLPGKRIVNYAMASRLSRALFNDLRVKFEGADVPMLAEVVCTLLSEHSERATMSTWAEGAGIPEYVRKQMGRWTIRHMSGRCVRSADVRG